MAKKIFHRSHARRRYNPAAIVLVVLVLAALGFDWWLLFGRLKPPETFSVTYNAPPTHTPTPVATDTPTPGSSATPVATPKPSATPIPGSALINVPFQVQAPNANWDALHEETCEEASILMVRHYMTGAPIGSASDADTELKSLVSWESDHSFDVSITVEQLKDVAAGYYGTTTGRIVLNPTVTDIKQEIASGRPVIIPAAGRVLQNPYFTAPGPLYHMLVIKGYDDKGFITNDPGIKQGNGFRYSYDNIMSAIHDWNGTNDILQGGKAYLVFD